MLYDVAVVCSCRRTAPKAVQAIQTYLQRAACPRTWDSSQVYRRKQSSLHQARPRWSPSANKPHTPRCCNAPPSPSVCPRMESGGRCIVWRLHTCSMLPAVSVRRLPNLLAHTPNQPPGHPHAHPPPQPRQLLPPTAAPPANTKPLTPQVVWPNGSSCHPGSRPAASLAPGTSPAACPRSTPCGRPPRPGRPRWTSTRRPSSAWAAPGLPPAPSPPSRRRRRAPSRLTAAGGGGGRGRPSEAGTWRQGHKQKWLNACAGRGQREQCGRRQAATGGCRWVRGHGPSILRDARAGMAWVQGGVPYAKACTGSRKLCMPTWRHERPHEQLAVHLVL